MAEKPILHYFNGRGRMECVRWLLAAAGVEFDEKFLETKEQYEELLEGGNLLFQQVPMVEIDGMHLVQTRAILNYIADKYNLYGNNLKERAFIDMYFEGILDLMVLILPMGFMPEDGRKKQKELIKDKATNRYLPVYEKVLKEHGQDFLVGNRFSRADVHLLEVILMLEEVHNDIIASFPNLQAFKERISEIPTIKKFLQPGSQRKPIPNEKYVSTVKSVLGMSENTIMTEKPILYYFNGRGRMECVRWLLAAAGVEFDEKFIDKKEQYEELLEEGNLLFQQIPMVEIDGMHLVQTRAILNYIAGKYNLFGNNLKERAFIDMYFDGILDLMGLILTLCFLPEDGKEKQKDLIRDKATNRYLPVYEKVLKEHCQDFLVGNRFSMADVHLLEVILMLEEVHDDIIANFPNLQAFKERTSEIPTIKKFLQPGSQRKPMGDDKYVSTVKSVLGIP
ncbi:uncharacterized protein WCC33_002878 [Rhinophrynus dorsalis]